jgi:hypothetical protein
LPAPDVDDLAASAYPVQQPHLNDVIDKGQSRCSSPPL